MKICKYLVISLSILLLFSFMSTVSAETVDNKELPLAESNIGSSDVNTEITVPDNMKSSVLNTEILSIVKGEVSEEGSEKKVEKLQLMQGENLICSVDSPEFKSFVSLMAKSISNDAYKGLEELKNSKVTQDYIRLSVWGDFLNKYISCITTAYPVGNIKIKFDNYDITIASNDVSKKVIAEQVVPALLAEVKEVAKNYPVVRYVLEITEGSLLKDYELDLKNVKAIKTVLPFDNMENMMVFTVGSYYGLTLSSDYVTILRGYIDGNKSGYDRPVEGIYPGCVNVLAYVTLLKNVEGNTLDDKNVSDFMIYNNLAVCLDTKELINTADMTTTNQSLKYSDFKLDLDKLLLVPIKDDVVIIQPTYLECFYYNDLNKGLNRYLDVTSFVSEGKQEFTIITSDGVVSVPMSQFVGTDGLVDARLGQSPFLMYYNGYTPYDLIISWLQSTGKQTLDEDVVSATMKKIKTEMYEANRKDDYNTYIKAAGLMTDTMKIVIGLIIFIIIISLIVGAVIFIKTRNKKVQTISNNSSLLIDDSDDGDDNDGDFELK